MTITNALTVDLEDWFQGLTSTNPLVDQWPRFESRVRPATELLLQVLDQFEVKATFFVLGYVADQHPELIRQIRDAGHELGVHGYYHRFVNRLTPTAFDKELALAKGALKRITGVTPIGHRAPYFSINAQTPWAFEVLAAHGFRYDSSVFPVKNMLYGYPDAPRFPYQIPGQNLLEFPASTVRLGGINWPIAGGFYLRAWPYALVRRGIRYLNRQGQAAIMYLHPWELDLEQPFQPVTARERLTHYHGRRGLLLKLQRLLTDFPFGPLCEQVDNIP